MFKALSRADLDRMRGRTVYPEYGNFMSGLKKGEGGVVDVTQAKAGKQTVKNRVKATAQGLGMSVKFLRSTQDEVIFEVTAR